MDTKQTPIVVLGSLIAVALLVLGVTFPRPEVSSTPVPTDKDSLGGGTTSEIDEYTNGIRFGNQTVSNWAGGTIGQGEKQSVWTNNLGRTVYVDLGTMVTSGTASSTFKLSLISTTTSSISSVNDYTSLAATEQALLRSINLATSTAATSTNSIEAAAMGVGRGVVAVPDGSSIVAYLQQLGNGCAAGSCEAATSSNRGFNITWRIRYHY